MNYLERKVYGVACGPLAIANSASDPWTDQPARAQQRNACAGSRSFKSTAKWKYPAELPAIGYETADAK